MAIERQSSTCNSRHFSLLMKSCCPNPNNPHSSSSSPSFIIPSNNKTPKKFSTLSKTSFSSLPDDLLYEILSRVSLSSLPSIAAVCRRWAHLVHSPAFYLLRRSRRLLHHTVFVFSVNSISTLRVFCDVSWRVQTQNDVVLGSSTFNFHSDFSHARLVAIGRKIFVITRSSLMVFDPWTGSVKTRSGPLFPRKRFAAAVVCGRIYVAGGSLRASDVEEYDPHSDEWRVVSHAPRRRYGCIGVGVDGVFYIIGGLMIGGASELRAAEARVCASSMDLYDVAAGGWLRSRAVPGGGCVVAACRVDGCVYVLASHAVELSFWRFNARRKGENGGGGGGGGFGEWCRMRSPPLPAQVRVDVTVRFSCVGVEDKVVLIQVMGCIDDLLRRSGRNARGYKEGLVLLFDCVAEEWSRGPDLPELVQRAACICVEC